MLTGKAQLNIKVVFGVYFLNKKIPISKSSNLFQQLSELENS